MLHNISSMLHNISSVLEGLLAEVLNYVGHTSWCTFQVAILNKVGSSALYLIQVVDIPGEVEALIVEEYLSLENTTVVQADFTGAVQSLRFPQTHPSILLPLFTSSSQWSFFK